MASFTATGLFAGEDRSVTWTDGVLDGDDALIISAEAAVSVGVGVLLAGLWSGPAALDTHEAALATLIEVFALEGVTPEVTGDEPEFEPVPDGTIV